MYFIKKYYLETDIWTTDVQMNILSSVNNC